MSTQMIISLIFSNTNQSLGCYYCFICILNQFVATFEAVSSDQFKDMSTLPSSPEDQLLLSQFVEKLRGLQQLVNENELYAKCGYIKAQLFNSPILSPPRLAKLKKVVESEAMSIFNESIHDRYLNDLKRRQTPISELCYSFSELRRLDKRIKQAFSQVCGEKLIYNGVVLLSLAGCAVQELHCDYPYNLDDPRHFIVHESDEAKRMKIRQQMHDNSRRSFVFFFALEEDTTLRILGHDGKIVTVKVKVGEALVASGFLIHSGDGK